MARLSPGTFWAGNQWNPSLLALLLPPAQVLWSKLQLNEIVFILGIPIEVLVPGTESFSIKLLRSLNTWTAHCSYCVLESMGSGLSLAGALTCHAPDFSAIHLGRVSQVLTEGQFNY